MTASATPGNSAYRVGALDVLDISVYKAPDLSKSVQVADSGTVNLPLIDDIQAVGKTTQKLAGAEAETDETGVWIGQQKIASLGIAVKKWVCYHGAAINLDHDPEAFQGLNPCGFKSSTMTNVEKILNKKVDRTEFQKKLLEKLAVLI